MKILSTVLSILVALAMLGIGMLFALQNKVPVPLDVLVYTFEPRSLALWILLAFALGGVTGLLLSSMITLRQRARLASTRRQLARSQGELERLRAPGLSGSE